MAKPFFAAILADTQNISLSIKHLNGFRGAIEQWLLERQTRTQIKEEEKGRKGRLSEKRSKKWPTHAHMPEQELTSQKRRFPKPKTDTPSSRDLSRAGASLRKTNAVWANTVAGGESAKPALAKAPAE